MAEVLALSLRELPEVKELLNLLNAPGLQSHRQSYISLLDYTDAITQRYDSILTELDSLKGIVKSLEDAAGGIGTKLQNLKNNIVSFTNNVLITAKEKGLSALGLVLDFLHVKDGLQAMSRSLSKSVARLDNTVSKICDLEKHNQEKAAERNSDETQSAEKQISLAELLADTRVDFENLSPIELAATYEKLLEIGMNCYLTANENTCLEYLIEEAGAHLPNREEYEIPHEAENEVNQGEEI